MNNQPVALWELRAAFGDEDPCWKIWGNERPAEDALFQFFEHPSFTYLDLLYRIDLTPNVIVEVENSLEHLFRGLEPRRTAEEQNEPLPKRTIEDLYAGQTSIERHKKLQQPEK